MNKKSDGVWEYVTGGKSATLSAELANKLTSALSPLEAFDFLSASESAQFSKEAGKTTVSFFNQDNSKSAEVELVEKGSDYWAKNSTKSDLYKIASYKLSDVLLTWDKITKPQ